MNKESAELQERTANMPDPSHVRQGLPLGSRNPSAQQQKWAACYSLFREDTDGSVTLFFGPLRESGQNWELPYEIVHEGASSENEMSIPKGMGAESSAGLFLQHISDALTNKLPIGRPGKTGG